jgi:hypothetical protein
VAAAPCRTGTDTAANKVRFAQTFSHTWTPSAPPVAPLVVKKPILRLWKHDSRLLSMTTHLQV